MYNVPQSLILLRMPTVSQELCHLRNPVQINMSDLFALQGRSANFTAYLLSTYSAFYLTNFVNDTNVRVV